MMGGNTTDWVLAIVFSPLWVTVLVVLAVAALLWFLLRLAFGAGQYAVSGSHRDRRHIYRERDRAIADIVAMRQEAEKRMRKMAREDDVIEGSAVDEWHE